MNFKPQNFFIGFIDFFLYLVAGRAVGLSGQG